MDEPKVVVVNEMVHAICDAAGRLIVYIQKPEHFKVCGFCTIYTTQEEFLGDQILYQLGQGIDGWLVCSATCPYCNGRNVYYGHPWDATIRIERLRKVAKRTWRRPARYSPKP